MIFRGGGPLVEAFSDVLKARNSKKALKKAIEKHRQVFERMDAGLALALCEEIKKPELKEFVRRCIIDDGENAKEEADVCKAMDDWEKENIKKGRRQAEKEIKQLKKEIQKYEAASERRKQRYEATTEKKRQRYKFVTEKEMKHAEILGRTGAMVDLGLKKTDVIRMLKDSCSICDSTARKYIKEYLKKKMENGSLSTEAMA